jgi:F-type H+-transporting ATPase subunit alpha
MNNKMVMVMKLAKMVMKKQMEMKKQKNNNLYYLRRMKNILMNETFKKKMNTPRAAELTTLLESRISNFYTNFQVDKIGRVVSVGDGIARVYKWNKIQAGEMAEFESGVKGIALNLENENVGIVVFGIFGSDTAI